MADPRAGDVADAERLLAQAAYQGAAKLPALSAAELWVLCGDRQVLADEAESRWWTEMAEPDREKLAAAIMELLADRGLLRARGGSPDQGPDVDATAGPSPMPMTPELALIVAARQQPAVVAVAITADGSAEGTPRMFGLADHDQPPRVVVAEYISEKVTRPFGRLHHFSLLSVKRGGHTLSSWATEQGGGLLARRRKDQRRIVDVYRSQFGAPIMRDRVIIGPGSAGSYEVSRQRPETMPEVPVRRDRDQIASLLAAMLTGDAP
ncbi:MAG: hypothetical protein ACTHJW_04555 [Streptosporangiaceae bacterium]